MIVHNVKNETVKPISSSPMPCPIVIYTCILTSTFGVVKYILVILNQNKKLININEEGKVN
tara:strand:+ start:256 stop:438 length:183 start_codon:yes stop_codon:yes gene_type:complete